MMHSRFVTRSRTTRRSVLKAATLGSVAAIAAPYVKGTYAAGTLRLGVWDHFVPGANNPFTVLCNEWGAMQSWPVPACASAAAVMLSLSPRTVM
jgi:hypothetical protein